MNFARRKKILIMAGGTGGHVYPALAIAAQLRGEGYRVEWLGTRKGIEARLVPAADIALHCLSITGVRGKRLSVLLKAPFLIVFAIVQALRVCRRYRPDCVLGMGGFASGPGGVAARLLGIPLVIQEQNAVAGTTNRILSRLADVVLEGFAGAFGRAGAQHSGNPVRAEISAITPPEQRLGGRRGALRMLVVGGSLGAQVLNEVVPQALAGLADGARPQVWHQAGPAQFEATETRYRQLGLEGRVVAYIDDMAAAYAWADFVVCRAGALTVAELAAAGLAAVLVPLPHAIDDHQTANARWLADQAAAVLMPQPQFNPAALAAIIERWGADRMQLVSMACAARACAKPDATRRVADCCKELANERSE